MEGDLALARRGAEQAEEVSPRREGSLGGRECDYDVACGKVRLASAL